MNYTRFINSLIVTVVFYASFIGLMAVYIAIVLYLEKVALFSHSNELVFVLLLVNIAICPSVLTGFICRFKDFNAYWKMVLITVCYFIFLGGLFFWFIEQGARLMGLLHHLSLVWLLLLFLVMYVLPSFFVVYYFLPYLIKNPNQFIFKKNF